MNPKISLVMIFFGLLLIGSIFVACEETQPNADTVMRQQTEAAMKEANAEVGMPAIINFQERKLMKQILELRDQENLLCYAYLKSEYTGRLIYIGKCIGYGLPYSVQYTNPERMDGFNSAPYTLPQADPNGLFMPTGLSATWLMMVDPETNEPRPVYVEPEIVVSPFLLQLGTN